MLRQLSWGQRACLRTEQFRQEFGSVNHAPVLLKNFCLPDAQVVVSHEEDFTTVPKPAIYSHCWAAFETEHSNVFDRKSVDPSDWVPTLYEHYCQGNGWNTEKDPIVNLRQFLFSNARRLYDLQIVDRPKDKWTMWKVSLMKAFNRRIQTIRGALLPDWEWTDRYQHGEKSKIYKPLLDVTSTRSTSKCLRPFSTGGVWDLPGASEREASTKHFMHERPLVSLNIQTNNKL